MKYVNLGGRQVSAIGLGTWQFGAGEWDGADFAPDEARRVVHRALDLGINFFDTAEVYGAGRSEELLGGALRGNREAIVATKVWPTRVTPGAVAGAARRSLGRLGREVIDLYQVHWPNPLTPLEWTMKGMCDLVASGLVQQVGVSNFGTKRWRRAEQLMGGPPGVVSNQVSYHLLGAKPERELLPYASRNGKMIIAYSPLAQGLVTGSFEPGHRPRRVRAVNPLFWPENLRRARPVAEVIAAVAHGRGVTPAQIALAWTIRSGSVIAIPGSRRVEHVEENAAAADLELELGEVRRLDEAAAAFKRANLLRSVLSVLGRG